jgi:two-component system sensor histidine kinase KdpD
VEINEKARRILENVIRTDSGLKRGRLKIFLGMVAGVGKTYAMINGAHLLKKNGVNVVIGLIETHGRIETESIIGNLPIMPRTVINYRGKNFQELDIDEIIFRRPEVVLVDELAHTNIPGSRHEKRYQDVQEILGQGIDVYTTLNVQHIESCAGVVQNITGVPINETLPDSVLDIANEIILIDVDPDQIIERLKSGKIYPPDKIKTSLENFFTKSNLIALRETVLRLLADRVNVELRDFKVVNGIPQIWKTSFRILVPILPTLDGEYLVRMTRRLASGLNARWIAAQIETFKKENPDGERLIKKHSLLAKQLGADVTSVNEISLDAGIKRLIKEHQITHLVIPKNQKSLFRQLSTLASEFPDVDIIILSPDKNLKSNNNKYWKRFDFEGQWSTKNLIFSSLTLGILTSTLFYSLTPKDYLVAGMIFLIYLTFNAFFSTPFIIMLMALTTSILWNILFIPPRFSFHISAPEDILMLFGFVAVSFLIGLQSMRVKRREKIVESIDERLGFMYFLTTNLFEATGITKIIQLTLDRLSKQFRVQAGVILASTDQTKTLDEFVIGGLQLSEKELIVARWAFLHKRSAGRFTDTLGASEGIYLPLVYRSINYGVLCILPGENLFSSNQISIFEDVARHLALVIEKENLNENTKNIRVQQASEKIYSTILNSVSHELKTPLAAISGAASSLQEDEILKHPEIIKNLSQEILWGSQRMQGLIQNLLDMSRIEAGKITLKKDSCDIKEILGNILTYVERYYADKKIEILYNENQIPFVYLDQSLIEQAIKNIIQNACLYSPEGTKITLTVGRLNDQLRIVIKDNGPGLPSQDPSIVFQKFYKQDDKKTGGTGIGLTIAKAIIELHGGQILATNHQEGGAVFTIKIPAFNMSK